MTVLETVRRRTTRNVERNRNGELPQVQWLVAAGASFAPAGPISSFRGRNNAAAIYDTGDD